MNDTEDRDDLTIFSNLMHEFDSVRTGIRRTIGELNRATSGNGTDIPRVQQNLHHLVEQWDFLDVLFEFLRIELNPRLVNVTRAEINIHGIFLRAMKHYSGRMRQKEVKWKVDKVEGFILDASPSLAIIAIVLIDNATKYSPRGGVVQVGLDAERRIATVESDGPRIEDDEIEAIFDRQVRGRHALLTQNVGQGLGLYMAKRLCDAHHFRIMVKQSALMYRLGSVPYSSVTFVIDFNKIVG